MSISELLYTVIFRPSPVRKAVNHIILALLPKSVRFESANILLNPQDPVVSGALALGVYEKEELRFFSKVIRPGMTVVDVGANLGVYSSVALSRLRGAGTLLAVEPARENFRWLKKNLQMNRGASKKIRIHAVQAALSNREGVAVLHKNPNNKGDNRLYCEDHLLQGKEEVSTITLDALCGRHGIRSINILKIDVQGLECQVLEGAKSVLRASPGCHLFCEFWAEGILRAGAEPKTFFSLLANLGFKIYQGNGARRRLVKPQTLIQATRGRKYLNIYGVRCA